MSERESQRCARVALAYLVEPGRRDLAELLHRHGPVEALDRIQSGDAPAGLRAALCRRDTDLARAVDQILAHGERLGARVVIPEDDEWPHQVADLMPASRRDETDIAPPICLWVRGAARLDDVLERSVAVVGARAATEYGVHVASELGFGLADRGWTVVSGGAYGIDAAAHRGALTAGGPTAAVFACGVDTAYPVGHVGLFDRIADTGLLISEWPPGVTPQRHRFLIRNRVIAAATRGTVMVEAAARSGARATLNRARRLGRGAMAMPGLVTSAMSVGSHIELREARARLVTNTDEVVEEVGRIGDDLAPVPRGGVQPRDGLSPEMAEVLDALPAGQPVTVDELAAQTGLTASELNRALPLLVLAGMAEETDGRYRLSAGHRAPSSAAHRPRPRIR
ncbi:MAG: DNA-processing protein DprA [Micromonosporaceae bacterium]